MRLEMANNSDISDMGIKMLHVGCVRHTRKPRRFPEVEITDQKEKLQIDPEWEGIVTVLSICEPLVGLSLSIYPFYHVLIL